MDITDMRRVAHSRPLVGERTAASHQARGRHRRPSTRHGAAAWLAGLPGFGGSVRATWLPAVCGTAICGCAVLVLAGLVGVRRGANSGQAAGSR